MPEHVFPSLRKRFQLAPGKAFTLGTLLIIVAFGVLFYVYVSKNYTYLVDRNFRLLATWSQELSETYANSLRSIQFRLDEMRTDTNDLVTFQAVRSSSPAKGPILQDFEDISAEPLYFEDSTSIEKTQRRPPVQRPIQEKLGELPYVKIEQVPKNSQSPALPSPLPFGVNLQPGTQDPSETPENEQGAETMLTASFALDRFIKAVATEPVFSDVLLIDPTGLIVYQRNPSSLRFFHLRNLLHNQQAGNGWWADILKKSGLDSSRSVDDRNLTEAIQAMIPAHIQAILGGTEHEIFMQAVVFPETNGGNPGSVSTPTPWILCGLLPTNTFREHYFAVPFTVLLIFILLLISALLILPFLSLVLMGTRERLSRFSVGTLILTNILGAGVGTFFVLDLTFLQQTTSSFNEQVAAMADSTHEAFQIQLDRLVWQLSVFDQKITELQDLERLSSAQDSNAWLARVAIPDPCTRRPEKDSRYCFPEYSLAFWIDGEGRLRETWTPGNTPYVRGVHDLRHRDYVSQVQNPRLPLHRRTINNQWFEFYVQPVINLENSERSVVVSMPHGGSGEHAGAGREWIAAIQTEKLGLVQSAVVPPGSGLAVIDNQTGKVLFHSDAHRMLRENFFEETDENPELAALIHARAEGGFDGQYWGAGHHFYAKPIEELPWTLVVFRNKDLFRTINFEILIFSSCLFTLYILALFVWLKVLSLRYRSDGHGRQIRWLWPRQASYPAYNRLSLVQGGLSILGVILVVGGHWQADTALPYAVLGLLLPFLGIWWTVRTLWRAAGKDGSHAEQSLGDASIAWDTPRLFNAFARWGTTGFILLGVLPAMILFKLAHDEEMRLFVQQQMWGLAHSLEGHNQARWRQVGVGETRQNFRYVVEHRSCPDCPTDERRPSLAASSECSLTGTSPDLQYTLQGMYMNVAFPLCLSVRSDSPTMASQSQPETPWWHTLHQMARKSSLRNRMNQESWGFIRSGNQTSASRWSTTVEGPYQAISLALPHIPSHNQRLGLLELQAAAPLFPWNVGAALFGMFIIGGLLLMMSYGLLRYVIVRIFPMPVCSHRRDDTMAREPMVSHGSLQHVLILGPQGSGKSGFIQNLQDEWTRIDLHATAGKASWADTFLSQVGDKTRAVVVDHFEYQWEDPAQDREKRTLVEGLLSRDIKVCIMSARNPYDRHAHMSSDSSPQSSPGFPNLWIDIFRTFGLAYFMPHTLETVIREWLNPQAGGGPAEERGQLLPANRLLKQETDGMVHLRKIGKWIRAFREWPMWSPKEMKEQFRLAASPYYQALWDSCSPHEKLALYHVASEGYLHADNPELAALSHKGLVRLNPDLQILNASFRSFVLEMATHARIAEWEGGTNPDTWAHLKYPFLLIFVVVIVFLFATQQEFKHSFITLLSLLPILLPALPELPMLFAGQKRSGSSSV